VWAPDSASRVLIQRLGRFVDKPVGTQHGVDNFARDGLTEEITLHGFTAEAFPKRHLIEGFHALPGNRESKILGQRNDGLDNGKAVGFIGQTLNDSLINLDFGKGQLLEIAH